MREFLFKTMIERGTSLTGHHLNELQDRTIFALRPIYIVSFRGSDSFHSCKDPAWRGRE